MTLHRCRRDVPRKSAIVDADTFHFLYIPDIPFNIDPRHWEQILKENYILWHCSAVSFWKISCLHERNIPGSIKKIKLPKDKLNKNVNRENACSEYIHLRWKLLKLRRNNNHKKTFRISKSLLGYIRLSFFLSFFPNLDECCLWRNLLSRCTVVECLGFGA